MQDRPDHPTLLDALATFLMSDVVPKLEADKALQFRVLIAANLATVVAGESRTHDERLKAEAQRLAKLLPISGVPATDAQLAEANKSLAKLLRSGQIVNEATLEHLLATARETLAVTNPRFELP
ncbi:MAG: DUF6285 domain-containing protein [Archangium sp.]